MSESGNIVNGQIFLTLQSPNMISVIEPVLGLHLTYPNFGGGCDILSQVVVKDFVVVYLNLYIITDSWVLHIFVKEK
jgi:hypothetical protein